MSENLQAEDRAWRWLIAGLAVFVLAAGAMRASTPPGIATEDITITGPGNRPCGGTVWLPEAPDAVVLIGHGVSENRATMATIAKGYATGNYAAVAIDFWGHGRSRERFDWNRNPGQVLAWVAWARERWPDLPVAYVGHSMGGSAGDRAFNDRPEVDAFISLGMLPGNIPETPTLLALGRYEELFGPEEARARAGDDADVLVSPWSNHALEPWDPVLIAGMVAWTDDALGRDVPYAYPWGRWLLGLLATVFGCAGVFVAARGVCGIVGGPQPGIEVAAVPSGTRRWSLNPYRIAARVLRHRGSGQAPRSSTPGRALAAGLACALLVVLLLAALLDMHMFTSRPDHPARLLMWAVATLVLAPLLWFDAFVLERIHFARHRDRFLVAALTRAVPLLVAGTIFWFEGGAAFGGMMLGILAFIAVMQSLVYTLATAGSGDYRAGALAAAVCTAWVFCFWFPLVW